MSYKKPPPPPPIEPHIFRDVSEIDRAIEKLKRRIDEVTRLDIRRVVLEESGDEEVVLSNIRDTMREVFGTNSPESHEYVHTRIQVGSSYFDLSKTDMRPTEIIEAKEKGKVYVNTKLQGLIDRLKEKREELTDGTIPKPQGYFQQINLHSRIADVANDLLLDGHYWEAVFNASKALVNYIKERSGKHDLDGAPLVRTVFSRNNPILAFNDLSDQTDQDEQEGMMHLYEGTILAIRNPGGHTFPEGPAQRALEYLNLLSLLAYRVQEALKPLEILSARYGADEQHTIDLTQQIELMVEKGKLKYVASNPPGKDPHYGVRKKLTVKYKVYGVESTKEVEEDQTLILP